MQLKATGTIKLPDATGTLFDHGAFEPRSRRVFVAHTARDRVEVIDRGHLATLRGFPEAAGVVADDGQVLVTDRGTARLAWVDANTLEKRDEFETGLRPNGVAFVSRLKLAVVACIGDETHDAVLQALDLEGHGRWEIDLPGRPRWCVNVAGAVSASTLSTAAVGRYATLDAAIKGRARAHRPSSSTRHAADTGAQAGTGTDCGSSPVATAGSAVHRGVPR